MMMRHVMARLALVSATAMFLSAVAAAEPLDFKHLNLLNNWEKFSSETRTPAVAIDANGVVHLRGAIRQSGSTANVPFVLPKAYRPSGIIYVPVDLTSGQPGRLNIEPDGTVRVQSAGNYSQAQDFTSLEGVLFSKH
jgi:hypothetical protein